MRWLLGALLLTALFVGCLGEDTDDTTIDPTAGPTDGTHGDATPPTVIAVIDSGINPYHVYFQGARARPRSRPSPTRHDPSS